MTWFILSLLSAITTSLTTIFAKIGIKDVKSNFATTFRTLIVIIGSFVICLITNSIDKIYLLTANNWIFLILSGIATGCSWLCYFKALKLSNINKVAPIDKSSFILTSILFLIFFFNDTTNNCNVVTIIMLFLSMTLMLSGTILMIDKNNNTNNIVSKKWLVYAILSAVFASFVSLFIKIGLQSIPSSLGTLIRSIIVFIFSLAIVISKKEYKNISLISKKSWLFLTLSGIATCASWLLEYYALNIDGVNPVAVNSIGKLSILITMLFSFVILKEKFSKKSLFGLLILTCGIILIIVFNL